MKLLKNTNFGRSMVEMIGVLAIIGVLSTMILLGYRYAMSKHKANETMNDIMFRAHNIPITDALYVSREDNYEWTFSDLSMDEGRKGRFFTMKTIASHIGNNVFKVEVYEVPDMVCKRLLEMNSSEIDAIYVNENIFEGSEISTLCSEEPNVLAFYFDSNWQDFGIAKSTPQETAECASGQTSCGSQCCSEFQRCIGGSCCNTENICGNRCGCGYGNKCCSGVCKSQNSCCEDCSAFNKICSDGRCVCPSDKKLCSDGICRVCCSDGDCTGGQTCSGGICQ